MYFNFLKYFIWLIRTSFIHLYVLSTLLADESPQRVYFSQLAGDDVIDSDFKAIVVIKRETVREKVCRGA